MINVVCQLDEIAIFCFEFALILGIGNLFMFLFRFDKDIIVQYKTFCERWIGKYKNSSNIIQKEW